jgi:hypothetical protein
MSSKSLFSTVFAVVLIFCFSPSFPVVAVSEVATHGTPNNQLTMTPPVITVNDHTSIMDAEAVNEGIDGMTLKVSECVKNLGKPEDCQCRYPEALSRLRQAVGTALAQHPDWSGKVVSYRKDDMSVTVSFYGLQRQLSSCH